MGRDNEKRKNKAKWKIFGNLVEKRKRLEIEKKNLDYEMIRRYNDNTMFKIHWIRQISLFPVLGNP